MVVLEDDTDAGKKRTNEPSKKKMFDFFSLSHTAKSKDQWTAPERSVKSTKKPSLFIHVNDKKRGWGSRKKTFGIF